MSEIVDDKVRAQIILALVAWFRSQELSPKEAQVTMACLLGIMSGAGRSKAKGKKDLQKTIEVMYAQLERMKA